MYIISHTTATILPAYENSINGVVILSFSLFHPARCSYYVVRMCHCHSVENDLTDRVCERRVSFRLKQVPIDNVLLKLLTVVNYFFKQLLTMVPVGKYNNMLLSIHHENADNFVNSKRLLNSVQTADIIDE